MDRDWYLNSLKESLEFIESTIIKIQMNLYEPEKNMKSGTVKNSDFVIRSGVTVSKDNKEIKWWIIDTFSIDVSHSTIDKLRGLYEHMVFHLKMRQKLDHDIIKKIALEYITTKGLT